MKLFPLDLTEARAALVAQAKANTAEEKKAAEALGPQLFQLGDPENVAFQRITSPNTRRDLNPLMHERMQQVCFYLSVTTPMGKRIVEIITSYVVGEGFNVVAKDPAVQEIIDRFWKDPINDFERSLRDYSNDISAFGEICLPVAVNPVDGFVRMGWIDPIEIDAIEYQPMMTAFGETTITVPAFVRLKKKIGELQPQRLQIVHTDEDPNSETFGQLVGDCFFFAVNKSKAASRGLSDLFCLADWLDVLDQMIFDFADRARFLNMWVWDVTLSGADDKRVKEFNRDLTKAPPRQGGVLTHNEAVKIEAKTPDMKGQDFSAGAQMVKTYGLGGIGLPPFMFADPTDVNRSTGEVMEGPTGKKLTDRQNEIKRLIRQVVQFVLHQAVAHGVLSAKADLDFDLQVPDLLIKDLQKAGTTMQAVTGSLAAAKDEGWITEETAARSFHVVLSQIGVQVDSQDEFAAAQKEKRQRDATAQNSLNDQKNLADALNNLGNTDAKKAASGVVQ
ncbi:hypothetical protein Acid345_3407 [Candidatus Koribacter versatilis Ellin345]|uniref:Uncharacterized protein n=1 Tax=Koribacter versatilis (strain Ellin345) TaxID=204669 RepID=Q1IL42_KORVE|nr:hypothetical protein [Candidatus Koribacter versatilis]ABF42408.1 hypothetical protein Acid345_3407 [Candidatus Koribacter versatilis Ellin345]